ncbi:hypothetical protein DL95DRAFT_381026 [Leptodontidium sp. 2 PMI_412]|nr:hypothetical protein DL95DRAFT_381026 [Leptodontidium sp. 2 PMI_412]
MSFGWSVGDLIAAIQILVQVGQALKDSGGAADEYCEDSLFLQSLAATLEKLRQNPDSINGIKEQVEAVHTAVKELGTELATKFEKSLAQQTSRNKWKVLLCTAPARIEYTFFVSKKVKRLREQCSGPLQTVQLSLQLYNFMALSSLGQSLKVLPATVLKDLQDSIQQNLSTFHAEVEKKEEASQLENVLTWLQPVPTVEKYEDTLQTILLGSCDWLFQKSEMAVFTSSAPCTPSLLSVMGIPGAGKTNLATWFIHRLKRDRCVAYF